MPLVKAFITLPPFEIKKRGRPVLEPVGRYADRIVGYLSTLLYDLYKGEAHEINYHGHHVFSAEHADPRDVFVRHHQNYGWNMPLELEQATDEHGLFVHKETEISDILPQTFSPADIQSWEPDQEDRLNDVERPDYIHWTRQDTQGDTYILEAHLIKYYGYLPPCNLERGVPLFQNGILFAGVCEEDKMDKESHIFYRIGRTARTLDEMLTNDKIPHTLDFTVDNQPIILPPPRKKEL